MQHSLEVLRDIGEIFPNPWVAVDRDGRVMAYNRRFFGLFPREVALRLEGEQLDAVIRFESPGESRPRDVVSDALVADDVVHFGSLNLALSQDDNRLLSISAVPLKRREGPDETVEGALVLFGQQATSEPDVVDLAGIDPADEAGRKLLQLGETVRKLRAENARLRRKLYL